MFAPKELLVLLDFAFFAESVKSFALIFCFIKIWQLCCYGHCSWQNDSFATISFYVQGVAVLYHFLFLLKYLDNLGYLSLAWLLLKV